MINFTFLLEGLMLCGLYYAFKKYVWNKVDYLLQARRLEVAQIDIDKKEIELLRESMINDNFKYNKNIQIIFDEALQKFLTNLAITEKHKIEAHQQKLIQLEHRLNQKYLTQTNEYQKLLDTKYHNILNQKITSFANKFTEEEHNLIIAKLLSDDQPIT